MSPFTVIKAPGGGWDILKLTTGKVVGHSKSKRKAHISASIRERESKKKHGK